MKQQGRIPVGKVKRASRFLKTGAKVGGNYVKHFAKKAVGAADEEELHSNNAQDIYDSLAELKGSVLKVAQMMSMDRQAMPTAYLDKFAEAQYQTPPLSYPLIVNTFKKTFGCAPDQLFDEFSRSAINAASMGQVHRAKSGDSTLAVKIQYPGVADSVRSDLRMAYPLAKSLLSMNGTDLKVYMDEVEARLIEETDYELELKRSMELSAACAHLDNLRFPEYYPQWCNQRVLTMEWIEGLHLSEYLATGPPTGESQKLGQALWDFYQYQIHYLKQLHADPHPGNFIITKESKLGVIDFGCVKVLPQDFYDVYFKLLDPEILNDRAQRLKLFYDLAFLYEDDNQDNIAFFDDIFSASIRLLGQPFYVEHFDFGKESYFQQIYEMGMKLSKEPRLRNSKRGRGSRHALYLNRTYFGLYNLLHQLRARIDTRKFLDITNFTA